MEEAFRRIENARRTGATELRLARLSLAQWPKGITELKKLQKLHLWANRITEVPPDIGELTDLVELSLAHNPIRCLPAEVWKLTKLTSLWLDATGLAVLPPEIGEMRDLTRLALWGNKLTSLPREIGDLVNLQELYLAQNQLTLLPETIGRLRALRVLTLDGNQLTTVPETIGQLHELRIFLLSDNKLTFLPDSLMQASPLEQLYLHGNSELGLPIELLGPTRDEVQKGATPAKPGDILEYYARTRSSSRPLNEAKLILLGFGGVGKTSLVNRLVRNMFNPQEEKTGGIDITEWPMPLRQDEQVRLHIWDFGGQEIMHATHQFFLTQRSLYILVLSGREGHEDADAEYWLSLINSFAADSPVVVVLNKIHVQHFALNRRALQRNFPNVRDFIETDCAEPATGINVLETAIRQETDRLPHLRDAFPTTWFQIKDRLAGMDENYITFEHYQQICCAFQETDPQAQESLAFYLHSLGIALNYKDDARLRDMNVLNPRWVTEGVYRIINNEKLAQQGGELCLSDLGAILDPTDYPRDRHEFLLELMRKFELCFRFPESDERYLVPDLLAKEPPAEVDTFTPETSLNFEYHYPVLLEGLLPRFIVRTYVLSQDWPRWRHGVILNFEGNRALVAADRVQKRVRINIAGPPAGRKELLAVIRSDFAHIHREYTFEPQAMVPVPRRPEVLVPYAELLVFRRKGIESFHKVVGEDVIVVSVKELLEGVDLGGEPEIEPDGPSRRLKVFYSYSHADEDLRDKLATHLKILERRGLIEPWHDRRIPPGTEWKGQIDASLERADLILLLVSANFVSSDYCYKIEMARALKRHDAGAARVIPIIVRDCHWRGASFGHLQPLPKDGRAVTSWRDRDAAWRDVAEGIEKAIEELRGATGGQRSPQIESTSG
jgi:internalin A